MFKKFLTAFFSVAILSLNTGLAFAADLPVPAGTTLPISITSPINSDLLEQGDIVSVKVLDDVMVNGQKAFTKDTVGIAYVTKVKHSRHHGGAGFIQVNDAQILDVNKIKHNVQLSMQAKGDGCRPSAILLSFIGTCLILTPFGIWKHGEPAILSPAKVYNGVVTTQFNL